jgi:hypothetical protein
VAKSAEAALGRSNILAVVQLAAAAAVVAVVTVRDSSSGYWLVL